MSESDLDVIGEVLLEWRDHFFMQT